MQGHCGVLRGIIHPPPSLEAPTSFCFLDVFRAGCYIIVATRTSASSASGRNPPPTFCASMVVSWGFWSVYNIDCCIGALCSIHPAWRGSPANVPNARGISFFCVRWQFCFHLSLHWAGLSGGHVGPRSILETDFVPWAGNRCWSPWKACKKQRSRARKTAPSSHLARAKLACDLCPLELSRFSSFGVSRITICSSLATNMLKRLLPSTCWHLAPPQIQKRYTSIISLISICCSKK